MHHSRRQWLVESNCARPLTRPEGGTAHEDRNEDESATYSEIQGHPAENTCEDGDRNSAKYSGAHILRAVGNDVCVRLRGWK